MHAHAGASRNIIVTFGANVGARMLSAVSMVILLRGLRQEEYGILIIVQGLISVGAGILLQGINWSVVRAVARGRLDEPGSLSTIRSGLDLTLGIGLAEALLLATALALYPPLVGFDGSMAWIAPFVGAGILSAGLLNYHTSVLQAMSAFGRAAALQLLQSALILAAYGLLLLGDRLSLPAVLLILIVGPPVASTIVMKGAIRQLRGVQPAAGSRRRVMKDAVWYMVYSSLLAVSAQLDVLMMGRFFDLKDVADYGVASKLFGIILLGLSALHAVLLPAFAETQDLSKLRRMTKRAALYAAPFSLAAVAATWVFGEQIVWVLGGDTYLDAAAPLRILGLCAGISLVFSPSVNVFFSLNRWTTLVAAGVTLMTLCVAGHLTLTRAWGAEGAALTTLVSFSAINIGFFVGALAVTRKGRRGLESRS